MEIGERSLALLNSILDEGTTPETPEITTARIVFCYRHGCHISRLGNDLLFLLSNGRHVGAKMIVRPMLESMFNVTAAYQVQTFCVEKILGDLERLVTWLSAIANPHKSMNDAITDANREIQDLTSRFGSNITSNRWKLVSDVAKAGNHERHYKKDYAYFCDFAHSNISGLLQLEQTATIGNDLQAGTSAMLVTSAVLSGILTLKDGAQRTQEASILMKELNASIVRGEFATL